MARHIHIHVSTKDAGNWEENKHPRADNGQFGSGSGGGAKPAAKTAPAAKKAADPAKMQSTLATINKRLAAGNLTSASKEELTAKRNRIKIEMEKGKLSKSEPKEGDVGHEELTKYGKYLTKGEKVKGPRGEQVEVIRHTGPEVLTTGGSYHPTKLSRVDGGEKRAVAASEWMGSTPQERDVERQKQEEIIKNADDMDDRKKAGEIKQKAMATLQSIKAFEGTPSTGGGKINTNTEAGRSLASGLLKQATSKPSAPAAKAAPVDYSAGAKRAHQESLKATGPAKQDWTQASKYYNMARSEASSENPDKGTIREAEAKARYHEARAQGKPIEMPDY